MKFKIVLITSENEYRNHFQLTAISIFLTLITCLFFFLQRYTSDTMVCVNTVLTIVGNFGHFFRAFQGSRKKKTFLVHPTPRGLFGAF